MVLGMKSNNNRRSAMLQTDYTIHLKEIKPWPPSQSLNSLRSVLIQWEYGPQISGTTTLVIPTLGSVVGEGKIMFNQSFNISVALPRMMSIRSTSFKAFQKNCLELNLYEPRRDKVRGLLLGTAVIDFAEYGILEEVVSVNVVLNCKRNFRNICQPVVFIDIVPMKNGLLRSCSEMSMDRNGGRDGESVLKLMSEEYAKEAAVKSVIDDDGGSSHSSLTVSSSAFELNDDVITDEGSLDSGAVTPVKVETCFSGVLSTNLKPVSNAEVLVDENVGKKPTHFQEANESATKPLQNTTRLSSESDSSSEKNIHIGEFDDEEATIFECSAAAEADSSDHNENDEESSNAERTRLKQVKSVRSLSSFSKNDSSERCYRFPEDATTPPLRGGDRKELRFHSRDRNTITENRVAELEQRIKILEQELREAAAIEFALYSAAAEHGSSKTKVHTPARRLSRLYLRALEQNSRASAAKSSVSGLVLVAKACGNDVTRLMYWLSNCLALRSIITLATGYDELPLSTGLDDEDTEKSSSFNDEDFINIADWNNPQTYTNALQKLESWIFCRIIESLWWQTLVPYMQCYEESFDHIHITSLMNSRFDESNFPVELWNEAFKEVSERLCPIRATMRECGCLPVLSRLVIEQCVARLDVSMFNAILRESADEVPTDPVSDPISDPRVLPVPVGKSSFGAGAQLKNAIGKWCRRIDELFNVHEHNSPEMERDNEDERQDSCTKLFYHLNTLSDLMMLPKDMLLDKSVRKEVCPTLGSQVIKRLLNFHVPDEFCTDLVPVSLLDALDSEDLDEPREECISHVPCRAAPPVYNPPAADSLTYINGKCETPELRNSGLLLVSKSYTSDDELDELQSSLSFVLMEGSGGNSTRRSVKDDVGALRYRLLKEVWRSSR